MISHCKFLKTYQKEDRFDKDGKKVGLSDVTKLDYIFLVSNGQDIMRFNIQQNKIEKLGSADDAIIAFSVTKNILREKDDLENYQGVNNFEGTEHQFSVICLNESQQITIL